MMFIEPIQCPLAQHNVSFNSFRLGVEDVEDAEDAPHQFSKCGPNRNDSTQIDFYEVDTFLMKNGLDTSI